MIRWGRIIGVTLAVFAVVAGRADAASYARAVVVSCDKDAREAVFEGQMRVYRKAPKMQMRFTLQALTKDSPKFAAVALPNFSEWVTAPANVGKYTYDKTVQDLLPGANYRVVVTFRWKSKTGRTLRTERAISPVCKQPDVRPDLVVRNVRIEDSSFVGVVFNRGREAAGPFAVDFLVDGTSVGTVEVTGLASQTPITVMTPSVPCAAGTPLEVVADARAQVDEADEENNSFETSCNALSPRLH
ncbi:CARDB domain-containing protein [Solirubrobacter soli]|uniref:CARDB domain-containing protein n=1 Tax=Solirubrobacter soli TaxID=363832 RepID=UPI000421CDE1|nr:CARDB domain-containing protein [Solirubrobacter soli]